MALTVSEIKAAVPKAKEYKLSDEQGLYLLVRVDGAKYWRLKYRFDGKEKSLSLGVFPETTLAQARIKRDEARALLRNQTDPSLHRRARKQSRQEAAGNSIEVVAREWLAKRGAKSESGDQRLIRLLERDLFPRLAHLPVNEISPSVLLNALRKIEERDVLETAHRAKQVAGQVLRYAVATGRAERDPSTDLRGALATPTATHFPSITDPTGVGKLMVAIHGYDGTRTVVAALKLSALLFCRQGELRHLEWTEINRDERRIELPATKMKSGEPHIIPLSRQALEILQDLSTGNKRGKYVVPSARGATRPLSENGVRTALRSMGYANEDMTPHGFRAMARTLLDEALGCRIEWIEQQLAHAVRDMHGRAYNRTKHLEQRSAMMQQLADYLDHLQHKALAGSSEGGGTRKCN